MLSRVSNQRLQRGKGSFMYRKKSKDAIKHFDFILWDVVCLQLSFILGCILRLGVRNPYEDPVYRSMALFMSVASLLVVFSANSFKNILKRGKLKELTATLKHTLFVFLFSTLYLFTMQDGQSYSRIALYLTFGIYTVLSYSVRTLWKQHLRRTLRNSTVKSLLIITTEEFAPKAIHDVQRNSFGRFDIRGLVLLDRNREGEEIDGISVVANLETAADFVCREWVDEILIIADKGLDCPPSVIGQLSETGVVIHYRILPLSEVIGQKQFVEKIGSYMVITSCRKAMTNTEVFLKRSLDILAGLAGCLITGIIYLFVAPIIKRESPGPVFFAQERVGKNGRTFKMYKFRSMYLDAEERKAELMKANRVADGMMFKMDFDPRIIGNRVLEDGTRKTGIGAFIRDTSLDEFPQFFNILKGDMSLIGTRPPTMDEYWKYNLHHKARMAVKPGLTGMWQVSGRSSITDFEEVVRLDTQYIDEWSIGLDLKILFKTVAVVLKKDGAM